jgi:hypothetical protein
MLSMSGWAVCVQWWYRPLGGLIFFLLPVISIALTIASFVLIVTYLMDRTPIEKPFRNWLRSLGILSRASVLAFCFYSLSAFINAKWDVSLPVRHAAEVVDIRGGEMDVGRTFQYRYASLRLLDKPEKTEWLFLHPGEQDQLWIGHAAEVSIRRGFLGMPWISAVRRDDEKRLRAILAMTPTAARPWKDLITLYLEAQRWPEARQATADFLKIYPHEMRYVHWAASVFLNARRFDEMIALLEPLAQERNDYQVYSLLGFAQAMTGKKAEGVKLLNKAIRLDPENYWAYYALGYAHVFTGNPRAAVSHFKKVLEIRPDYPEIVDQLRKIQQADAAAHSKNE